MDPVDMIDTMYFNGGDVGAAGIFVEADTPSSHALACAYMRICTHA
jgi:hypothetical protein